MYDWRESVDEKQRLVRAGLFNMNILYLPEIPIYRCKNPKDGDWTTNIAFIISARFNKRDYWICKIKDIGEFILFD